MSQFFTRCLQDLPQININYVHRIAKSASETPASKNEKWFKMYIGSYIDNYEDGVKALHTSDSGPKPLLLCCRKCYVHSSGVPSLPDSALLSTKHSCCTTSSQLHRHRTVLAQAMNTWCEARSG